MARKGLWVGLAGVGALVASAGATDAGGAAAAPGTLIFVSDRDRGLLVLRYTGPQ